MFLLLILHILPSNQSINAAKIIAIIAKSNSPSSANLIDVSPIQTPIKSKHIRVELP